MAATGFAAEREAVTMTGFAPRGVAIATTSVTSGCTGMDTTGATVAVSTPEAGFASSSRFGCVAGGAASLVVDRIAWDFAKGRVVRSVRAEFGRGAAREMFVFGASTPA
jgi:hypothetical protein